MYKKVWLKGPKQNLKHQPCDIREISGTLDKKKDQTWQKYVTAETWSDFDCSELADFDFWIDIDAVNKSELSTEAALRASTANCALLLDYLTKRLTVDYEAIPTYFSGHGGFHLLLPFRLPKDRKHSGALVRKAAKQVVEQIAANLRDRWEVASCIDDGIYTRGRMIRFPESRHQSGFRKARIERSELDLPIPELHDLLTARSEAFGGKYSMDWWEKKEACEELEKWVQSKLPKRTKETVVNLSPSLTIEQKKRMTDMPSCLQTILELSPKLNWNNLRFNGTKMFVLGQFKAMGIPKDIAIELGQEFAVAYSRFRGDEASRVKERKQEVIDAARTIYDRDHKRNYDFTIPNKCGSIFRSFQALGKIACHQGKCPRSNPELPIPTAGRHLGIRDILKNGLTGNELLVYLTVALDGPFELKKDIQVRTKLDIGTISTSLKALESKKLIVSEGNKITACKPVRDKARGNFSVSK